MKYITEDEAQEYIKRMHGILGDRKPLDVLGSTVETLGSLLADTTEAQTQYKTQPDKWSARQIFAHLAEGEMVLSVRLRQILAETGTAITAYSQDKWAEIGRYESIPCHSSLELLTPIRRFNMRLLRSLSPEQFSRFGMHEERGRETITDMVRIWAGHDLNHLQQIKVALQASRGTA